MKYYITYNNDGTITKDNNGYIKIFSTENILNNLFDKSSIKELNIVNPRKISSIDEQYYISFDEGEMLTDSLKNRTYNSKSLKTIKKLIADNCNVRKDDDEFFIWACAFYPLNVIKYLHESYKCDINVKKGLPLIQAISEGRISVVKYLVAKEANINIDEDSPVFFSVFREKPKIMKYLIEKSGWKDDMNMAFCYACENGYVDVVKFMLKNGADVNYDYCNPVYYSILNNHVKILKLLINTKKIDIEKYREILMKISNKNKNNEIKNLIKNLIEEKNNAKI